MLANWDKLAPGVVATLHVERQTIYAHPGEAPANVESFKRVEVVEKLPHHEGWLVQTKLPRGRHRSYALRLFADKSLASLAGRSSNGRPLRYDVDEIKIEMDRRPGETIKAWAARRAHELVGASSATSSWGKPGSQAEAYKRIIMSGVDDDLEVHELVAKELGKGKAGPAAYAHWYRRWLVKHGHRPSRDK